MFPLLMSTLLRSFATFEDFPLLHEDKNYSESKTHRGKRETYKKDPKVEEPPPKEMIAINCIGVIWPRKMKLQRIMLLWPMKKKKNTEKLNTKISKLSEELSDCETDLYNYKRGSTQVEARLVEFKENEIKYYEKIRVVKRDTELKDNKIEYLRNELEEGIPQDNINDKGYWDSGCSRHMTGNISYLSEYEPFNGGYVSFGHGRGKITGKGSIKTEDHLAKFHNMADAKEMLEAIKSRFSGNDESKKMQQYLLKQQFEGFFVSASKGLHKGYDRTKPGLDTLSFDDLYNNLRVFERDVKGTTASSSNTQNVAFLSTYNTSSANDVDMISMRIKKFHKRTCRRLQFDTKDPVGFDKTKVECFNFHKMRHFARDCRAKGAKTTEEEILEDIDWSGHVEEDTQNYAMMSYSSSNSGSDNEVKSCFKACEESYARLKKLYDEQRDKLGDASVEITAYTLALKKDDPHRASKDKGIIDSGCSRYMTGNKDHFADYQEFKGGSVAFGGSNGRITGKGKIKAGRLDLKDVYYVEELKHYNLFSVSQMCNKKNKVLFTDTDCLVLSPDFKLPDENQKGKQHKASCKAKTMNSVNQPLQVLHITSDETTPILKDFIKQAKNQFNHKVKTIKSDNGTEFKKNDLIKFCRLKGIKREYSNAKCLQQNGVAKRKNRTLIEAARTMVFVTKPQNKTPYELLTENQANKSARLNEANNSTYTQANDDQDNSSEEIDLHEEHFVLPIWKEATHDIQNASTSSTNLINTASTPLSIACPSRAFNNGELSFLDDPLMPHLEDIYASLSEGIFIDSLYDDEGVVTDFNNVETTVSISLTHTIRIHTIHPKTQILRDHMSLVQTRSKVNKNAEAHALPLVKDEEAADMDVHLYRFMIGSLMYLTASGPDIMFAVCACSRKSIIGGCQFLSRRLISWQCKKQTIVATSTTEAEYIAAAHCKITPLFPSMLTQEAVADGEDSGTPTESQPIPSPTQPSVGDQPPLTESSSYHDSSQDPRVDLEGTGGSGGDQVNLPYGRPLSGGHTYDRVEGRLNLEAFYALCTNLLNRVLALETVKDAQAKEILTLMARIKKFEKRCKPSISHHQAWLRSVSLLSKKKKLSKGKSLSKQGRKNAKSRPTKDDSDKLDAELDEYMEYIDTEEAMKEGMQSIVDIARPDLKDDKAKGVAFKDSKNTDKPARSILTLKTLPTIDSKDNEKDVLEEPESAKKMTESDFDAARIARDEEIVRQLKVELQAKVERERQREEQASMEYIANLYDKVQELIANFVPIGSKKDERMIRDMNKKAEEESGDKERRYPLTTRTLERMRSLRLTTESASDAAYDLLRFIQKQFDAKGDEGYFIGYSLSSKAFRVFNKRSKKIEENLHVDFLKNRSIKKETGPDLLFDIDTLTNSMNYVPVVVVETSSTNISGTKEDVHQVVKENVSPLRFTALPNWFHKAQMATSNEDAKKDDVISDNNAPQKGQEDLALSSIVETKVPTVSTPVPIGSLYVPPVTLSVPKIISRGVSIYLEPLSLGNAMSFENRLEDFFGDTYDAVNLNDVEANLRNMETAIQVSPTLTLRIPKDHLKSQITGPIYTPVQTRQKTKNVKEQRFIATIHQKTNPDLLWLPVGTGVLTVGTLLSTVELEVSSNEPLEETFVLAVGFKFQLLLVTYLSLLTSSCSFCRALLSEIASSFFASSFEVAIYALWNQFGRAMNLRGDSFSFTA
uniref:Ribonuclease H-like domain-containing protein n=1 Tax=Tanacetum cinerariifolium TaxID=118510 RepID=A0A6L2KC84_TANCI|nr:ribonuclease H-like domain-containing protein [Tanacetum cinerariifolium]